MDGVVEWMGQGSVNYQSRRAVEGVNLGITVTAGVRFVF